ncbi:MAG TPA: hypothetical protein VLY04_04865 [Bryobacteraceae bacterium]|nr:hypothetical protein [Bryobacteraceae bacterium]
MGQSSLLGTQQIPAVAGASSGVPKSADPAKIRDAAQQFEAILLSQILQSAHTSEGGWLGNGSDAASDCATGFAEQQLAVAVARQGGLGLAKVIAEGITASARGR